MRLISLTMLVLLALCHPGASFAHATPSARDIGTWEARDVPDPERTPAVMKLLGVSLAGAEFSEQRLPGRDNFDYVYPTDREVFRYYAGKGFSIVRLPFLWERIQPEPYGPLAPDEVALIR